MARSLGSNADGEVEGSDEDGGCFAASNGISR
jgi:hypothetical protein